ncbi:hypothetical protein LMH87_001371 [Akanthomyces muscarius]|uniref:Serine-threonine/tyrosine-protein kinase catalytic domain-containing protein n=1 Tax=Akanthomyces muscarius TaxID=2231603 RepID=A0A9W8QJ97_AKAMU|nr:hypothetical protein LMH87_001371 [Akanthomyces muscarius]KAJ4156158.1 hypothetical protein LMH87_001371 [Akanthomyces muscarius]
MQQQSDQHALTNQENGHTANSRSNPVEHSSEKEQEGPRGAVSSNDSSLTQTNPGSSGTHETLWDTCVELYSLQFGNSDYFSIVEQTQPLSDEYPIYIVKRFSGINVEERMNFIQQIKHELFVQPRHIFSVENERFVTFEFMPLSLAELEGNPLMNDFRLASILGQVVQGLLYLEENSLSHTKLTCSNILIDIHGTVKLWGQEFIRTCFNLNEAIQNIAVVTMKLAQGYADKDGRFRLDRPERFPLGSDFLCALEQMTSIGELNQHPLLRIPWHKGHLGGLLALAQSALDTDLINNVVQHYMKEHQSIILAVV